MTLKTHLSFPCDYPLKIIGTANNLEAVAVPILRKHAPDLGEGAITLRPSSDKKYLAITAIIQAKNKEQLDALYIELTSQKAIIMVL